MQLQTFERRVCRENNRECQAISTCLVAGIVCTVKYCNHLVLHCIAIGQLVLRFMLCLQIISKFDGISWSVIGRTKLIVLGQILHTLFGCNFRACSSSYVVGNTMLHQLLYTTRLCIYRELQQDGFVLIHRLSMEEGRAG